MTNPDEFYQSPGFDIEPGDIFETIPFPSLKYPLTYFRIPGKSPEIANVFHKSKHGDPKEGDSAKSTISNSMVMLLSHGCEVERVSKREDPTRRYWLAAPITPLKRCSNAMQNSVRDGMHPSRLYLPVCNYIGDEEKCVDLRKITPITSQYFLDAKRICSLTANAQKALYGRIGVFFSGYALYLGPLPCPHCGGSIDGSEFQIPSNDEIEDD